MHPSQVQGILSLRTQPNLPEGQDVEAMHNRHIALEWLYRLSGRTNNLYSGLWQDFIRQHANQPAQED